MTTERPDPVTGRRRDIVEGIPPERLGIKTHIHALRHYSAIDLLTAGVDLRTAAGRLGWRGANDYA